MPFPSGLGPIHGCLVVDYAGRVESVRSRVQPANRRARRFQIP